MHCLATATRCPRAADSRTCNTLHQHLCAIVSKQENALALRQRADVYSYVHQYSEGRCHRSTGSICIRIGFELLYIVLQTAQHRRPSWTGSKTGAKVWADSSHQTELARELEQFHFPPDGRFGQKRFVVGERTPAAANCGITCSSISVSKRHWAPPSRITEGRCSHEKHIK